MEEDTLTREEWERMTDAERAEWMAHFDLDSEPPFDEEESEWYRPEDTMWDAETEEDE